MQLPSLAAAEMERKGTLSPERFAEAERFALARLSHALAGPPPRARQRAASMSASPRSPAFPTWWRATRGFIADEYVKHLRAGGTRS